MEEPKPPPRALPPIGTAPSNNSVIRTLPQHADSNNESPRALPRASKNSKGSFLNNSELLDDSIDSQNDTLRNRSAARMKRRTKNASQVVTADQSRAEDQPPAVEEEEVTHEKTKKAETRRTRAARREALRSKYPNVDIPENGAVLMDMITDEDVVPVDHLESHVVMTALPGVAGNAVNSQPQDKVYVQTTTGFKSHPNEWLVRRQMMAAEKADNSDDSLVVAKTSNIALGFHKVFMFIGFLIHGFLGGISIWQIVYPFSLNAESAENFRLQYFRIAQAVQTAFYFMLTYCLISALDRFNLGRPGNKILWRLLKFDPSAWLVAVYFLAFVFNVGISGIDFWLGRIALTLPSGVNIVDAYLNENPDGSVTTWLVINVLRCTCCIFGWLIVSVRPKYDDTAENLFDEENE